MGDRKWLNDITEEMLPEAHRKLAGVIGVEATLKLCEVYGGLQMYVPVMDGVYSVARARLIRAAYNGMNTSQLALKYGLSTRGVQKIVEDLPPPQLSGQIDLFDAPPPALPNMNQFE